MKSLSFFELASSFVGIEIIRRPVHKFPSVITMEFQELSDKDLRDYLAQHNILDLGQDRDEMEAIAMSLQLDPSMEACPLVLEPPSEPTIEKINLIVQLVGISGLDDETASIYLEACAWNLEDAISLCTPGFNSPVRPGRVLKGEANIPVPPIFTEETYEQQHGIRRPDQAFVQRLTLPSPTHTSRRGGGRRAEQERALGRADDPSVDWMFPPPRHISNTLPFNEAKLEGKAESKWLLVNLQSHEEFSSHMLNRDTWTDEAIEGLCRSSFTFWQRGHTSPQGREFMEMYRLSASQLPYITIIDPRTGASLLTITGFVQPQELAAALVEFLDENSQSQHDHTAPKGRGNIKTSTVFDQRDLTEEAESDQAEDESAPALVLPPSDVSPPSSPQNGFGSEYGSVPEEPCGTATDEVVKLSLKLPTGRSIVRRFFSSTSVRGLFALAASALNEGPPGEKGAAFELFTSYPRKNLSDYLDLTLIEVGLNGCAIVCQWK